MTLKTCLLVTDDADDHQAFTEAFSEISENTIVLIVLDSQKALELLKAKLHSPDYLFLDLSMQGIRINSFLKTIRTDTALNGIPTVVYGEESNLDNLGQYAGLTFFNKEYEYSELREFLKDFFMSRED
jgi:CheY-like chemotaxis protein